MDNQPDLVVVNNQENKAVVIDAGILSDIRKKGAQEVGVIPRTVLWRIKATFVPKVIETLGTETPKLEEWVQQIAGTTSEISAQKSSVCIQQEH